MKRLGWQPAPSGHVTQRGKDQEFEGPFCNRNVIVELKSTSSFEGILVLFELIPLVLKFKLQWPKQQINHTYCDPHVQTLLDDLLQILFDFLNSVLSYALMTTEWRNV